jgi:hypothetical protein
MIVVQASLLSAVHPSRDRHLARVEIANVENRGARADYVVRLYSAGDRPRLIRTALVENWPKSAQPAWRLIQAAMEALG